MQTLVSPPPIRNTARSFISLYELNARIKATLQQPALSRLWVVAEVSKRSESKGHTYLELIQKEPGEEQPRAQIKACIWNEQSTGIVRAFETETGIALGSGHKILFCASVQFNERHGISLLIHEIDPAYTLGDLARQKQLNLERLRREGLLDRQQALALPMVVQRLAVITSRQAFGGGDFFTTLKNPSHPYHFSGRHFPASVQGDAAAPEIIAQLERIGGQADSFDAVVIVRGGGQKSDFHCFENYHLARAIALCPLPVLTGIGHAWDEKTLSELASHKHFITPTATGEFLVGLSRHLDGRLDKARQVIARLAREVLAAGQSRLDGTQHQLGGVARALLQDRHEKLAGLVENTRQAPRFYLDGKRELFERQRAHATYLIKNSFERQHEQLRRLGEGLVKASSGGTEKQTHYLAHLRMMLVQASQFHVRYGHEQVRLRQRELRMESLELTNTELLLLENIAQIVYDHGRRRTEGNRQLLDWMAGNLQATLSLALTQQGQALALHEARVAQYDPVQLLKRGYSLTYADGKLLRSPEGLRPGTELTTRLENAIVVSKVVSVGEGAGKH
ncbi:MAG: exodeoxyribonuclease VII large subunit [Cytophagales bacterium]|nr:exodeoxyribonuclease VII large subunit [Cytophagales bacterium]